jgi:hypothetical protein
MHYFKQFLKRYMADWVSLLSGPIALPLSIYGIVAATATYQKILAVTLLVLGAFVSSYRVWVAEHIQLERAEIPRIVFPYDSPTGYIKFSDKGPAVTLEPVTIFNVHPASR